MGLLGLTEVGKINVAWHPRECNEADTLTKNLDRNTFGRCAEAIGKRKINRTYRRVVEIKVIA